ncbi:C40 family peptidase [Streptomyces sp. NPDC059852]|uniref:C40 family peptidase n=1 Tax=Streptomyces sp. NPDC059852 TaxID=3346972 RepID=UPI00366048ED
MAPERTGMRNSALASAAALTSVALLGQSAGAAQADEGPSREEVSRRVSSLYDRAETDTGTFNATRASSTGPRNRAGAPAASGRDGGRGSAALDEVARQWFDVARSKLGPTVPAVLPKDRAPERSAPARSARPSGGDGAREISGRTALELPAGSGAPLAELPAGTARPAAVGELTAGPVAALPAAATPALESGGALALPAPATAQPEADQRSTLRAGKERSQRKLAQARELLTARAGRTTPALEAPAAAPAPFPPAAQSRWDALEAQSPADMTTVPPGTTAPADASFVSGAQLNAPQALAAPDAGFAAPDAGFAPAVQTGSFPAVGQTGSFPMVDQTGSFPAVAQTGSFPMVDQTGSFPVVDQTGSFPLVDQTGGFPLVDQTGGFPAVTQSGSYPAAAATGAYPAAAPAPAAPMPAPQDSRALRALEFARAQIGKPCVWGTTGPNTFDGPGLTQAAWKAAGIALPRTAQEQATAGQGVALTHLEPGDLVLYHAGHVGIYSGNGMMIHAPGPGTVIREESVQYAGEAAIHSAIRPA